MFDLPNYSQLDKEEQDPIVDFELDKSLFVSGPPGSGKTVLALYRLSMAHKTNIPAGFLVYNQTLKAYVNTAIKAHKADLGNLDSTYTWHSWFQKFYQKHTGERPPVLTEDRFNYDWQKTLEILMPKLMDGSLKTFGQLILDEGQDFPKEFYAFLRIVTKAFTIFADENQRITSKNSTVEEIVETIHDIVPPGQRKLLTKNYRNSLEIAKFASLFYCGLSTGIPELPTRKGPKPLCYVGDKEKQIQTLVTQCVNNKNSVGVFLNTIEELKEVVCLLRSQDKIKDRVEYFHSDKLSDCPQCVVGRIVDRKNSTSGKSFKACSEFPRCTFVARGYRDISLSYRKESIVVLTHASAKGLEFDTVILPFLKDGPSTKWNDVNRMKFYVLSSRARNRLLLMRSTVPVEILDRINHSDAFEKKSI